MKTINAAVGREAVVQLQLTDVQASALISALDSGKVDHEDRRVLRHVLEAMVAALGEDA